MSNKQKESLMKKRRFIFLIIIVGIVFASVLAGLIVYMKQTEDLELQQNVYFTEFNITEEATTIFKYDPVKKQSLEIGRVKDYFHSCLINDEESYITGVLAPGLRTDSFEVIQYNLEDGSIEKKEFTEKVKDLTFGPTDFCRTLVYDDGNKILIGCTDEEGNEGWLFYDFETEQYNLIQDEKCGGESFLTIHNGDLWYETAGSLYRYNLETKSKTRIMKSTSSLALAPDTSLVAYTKDIHRKKVYLYDLESGRNRCIAFGGWNIFYADLFFIEAQWSDDGRYLFYIKYFPKLFHSADRSLMVYDVKSGRSYCIYKELDTIHYFKYVARD